MPANLKGGFILIVAAGLFNVMTLLIKMLGTGHVDYNLPAPGLHITQILLIRQAVMTLIVMPKIIDHFPGSLKTSRPGLQLLRVVLAVGAMGLGFTALIHLPLADVSALGFAKSFFVTIFAVLILREQVGWRRWLAVMLGFVGVAIMLQPGTDAFSVYGAMTIIAAACAGSVMILIRIMSRNDTPTTILSWQALGVGFAMAPLAWWYWVWPTLTQWSVLIAMGVVSYMAQMANIYAFKFGEASLLASLDYSRLLYATLFGYLIYETLPGIETLIGAAIIIATSIYTIWREAKKRSEVITSPGGRSGFVP